jgi:hypothetical protein
VNLFISRKGGESALRVRHVVLMGSVLAAMAGASVALAQAPGSGNDEPSAAVEAPAALASALTATSIRPQPDKAEATPIPTGGAWSTAGPGDSLFSFSLIA